MFLYFIPIVIFFFSKLSLCSVLFSFTCLFGRPHNREGERTEVEKGTNAERGKDGARGGWLRERN